MNSLVHRSTLTWLLFLGDIFGLLSCFHCAVILQLENLLDRGTPVTAGSVVLRRSNGDWRTPLLYRLIIVYLLGLYWADTYILGRSISTFSTCSLFCLGILATIGVITFCSYLTGFWGRILLFERNVLLNNQVFFNSFPTSNKI